MKITPRWILFSFLIVSLFFSPFPAEAQNMDDYTAYPPFVTTGTKPNLLLMIDNSSSMYDLAYIDNGNLPARESSYCYDQTYDSSTTYVGYFEKDDIYEYNFGSNTFETGSFPITCSHSIAGELCVNITAVTSTVNAFGARGNYLNWLTASKLDVQKQILTGGKYDTSSDEYKSESRGCVGRRYIKEPLTADYVEGGAPPAANNPLGITFAVNGPRDSINPTAPSPGGQTYIQIFEGDYNEQQCQTAIEQVNYASNPSAIRSAVEDCLSYDPMAGPGTQYCLLDAGRTCSVDSDCDNVSLPGDCSSGKKSERTCLSPPSKVGESCVNDVDCDEIGTSVGPCVGGTGHSAEVTTKIVFNQAMQECWQIWSGSKTEVGNDAWSAEAPKCSDVYAGYRTCNGGSNDGNTCTSDIECSGGGLCEGGPSALGPGSAALLCNSSYAGYCATTSDDWATTTWVAREYASPQECFLEKYGEFCGDVKVPQVIDPSDAPDDTAETANVPAIISDIGIESQLGSPIAELTANRYETTEPMGLLNDFSDFIRFGAMSFNFNGSDSECGAGSLNCPKVCSVTSSRVCTTDFDCPSGETCSSTPDNKDAAQIIHYIGDGTCSVTTSTDCVRDDQCPDGETCVASIGDHDSGLIGSINDIKANTWTPFAEAYYNAIAYFVNDATDNPSLDAAKYSAAGGAIEKPLNADDFDSNKNPIEYSCQKNNILVISDGTAATDLNATMTGKVTGFAGLFNDGDGTDPATCGSYSGSTYLDDLSYYANNKNIFNPTDSDPSDDDGAQRIKTHVVYTGAERSTETGECAPKTLMENTADNGGTSLYSAQDPSALYSSLKKAFQDVAKDAASGSAVSVLATTGEGSGSVYQAYFFPEKLENLEKRKWFGYIHSLFVDKYGNLREDSNGNSSLDLQTDKIIEMGYDASKGAAVYKCSDADGDGTKESCSTPIYDLEVIQPVWRGGHQLWERDPASRTIYTSIDGYSSISFDAANALPLQPYLRAADTTESTNIINWIRGDDLTGITDAGHADGYRKRDITIGAQNNVWKLGDIVYSTPTVVARPMENYDLLYGDNSYTSFRMTHRKRRHMVYVGANDGMLHAFNGGCFDDKSHKYYPDVDGTGTCTTGSHSLGKEMWAFIPRGLLPHLTWNTDPDYTHVYHADMKPKITDIKVFNDDAQHSKGWGTVLIGGFRYGGKDISWTSGGSNYSASPEYFALDITDPLNVRLLWSFSDPDLGLSMSYPSVAKIGNEWYAIFGSGATDYDSLSDLLTYQDGNVFVLKLSSGSHGIIDTWTLNTNYWKLSTGKPKSFLADPITIDIDLNYNVDAIYIGENYEESGVWNARMRRITTGLGTLTSPSTWTLSTLGDVSTISAGKDKVKRITSAPSAAMDDRANLWVFFGTGQFYGESDKNEDDSGAFYAIKDKCWNGTCTTTYSNLFDVSAASVTTTGSISGIASGCGSGSSTWSTLLSAANSCDGWGMYFENIAESVDFTGETLKHKGERMLSKPLVLGGLVTFSTYIPGLEQCSSEGESNVYAVYYKTGSAYKKYIFNEQKSQASPSDTVARVKKLGVGMPSSISAQVTSSGSTKGFVQSQNGSILSIETDSPFSLTSGVKGWMNEQVQ